MDLKEIKTCDLVTELKHREGVEMIQAEPYQKLMIPIEGPAVVLVVID